MSDIFEKYEATTEGRFLIQQAAWDFEKISPLLSDDNTKVEGEQLLKRWVSDGNDLRKAIASAWLARAASTIGKTASKASEHPVIGGLRRLYGKGENKAMAAGSRAGESFANSKPMAGSRERAVMGGYDKGRAAMSDKLKGATSMPDNLRQRAVEGAGANSASFAGRSHAGHYARLGATAAKWAYKAGVATAGAGVGAAATGVGTGVNDKQNMQRSNEPDDLFKGVKLVMVPRSKKKGTPKYPILMEHDYNQPVPEGYGRPVRGSTLGLMADGTGRNQGDECATGNRVNGSVRIVPLSRLLPDLGMEKAEPFGVLTGVQTSLNNNLLAIQKSTTPRFKRKSLLGFSVGRYNPNKMNASQAALAISKVNLSEDLEKGTQAAILASRKRERS